MAKKSSIEKNNRRQKMTKNAAAKRARLKAIISDKTKPMEERFAATIKLAAAHIERMRVPRLTAGCGSFITFPLTAERVSAIVRVLRRNGPAVRLRK